MTILTDPSKYVAGAAVLTILTIEFGGWFMTRIVRGAVQMTEFQRSFARAGHAHAGVLVSFGLLSVLLVDAGGVGGLLGWLGRLGALVSAALMSAGFFLSSLGRGTEHPNRWIWLVWAGAISLAAGVLGLGIGLLLG